MVSRVALVAFIVQSLFAAKASAVQKYVFHDLYTLGQLIAGSPGTGFPEAVGPGGEAVGYLNDGRAMLWNQANPSGVTLAPYGQAYGTDGVNQVGIFSDGIDYGYHGAALWHGSAGSLVDLGPHNVVNNVVSPWWKVSAVAVAGSQQVGYGEPYDVRPEPIHALLWSGTRESLVDLNPGGFDTSVAYGVGGGQQVGNAEHFFTGGGGAFLWTGSASSAIELNPLGSLDSNALGTDGSQQVGYALITNDSGASHAFVWSGSAQTAVDLGRGQAISVAGGKQVGFDNSGRVTVWSGTAGSAIDLSNIMPASYYISSSGDGSHKWLNISAQGNIFGIAVDLSTNLYHAFEILPVAADAGDYNHDGKVDARDYVVWRKGFGTAYSSLDYDVWRATFGYPAASGLSTTAVPEPVAWLMFGLGMVLSELTTARQRKRSHVA